MSKEMCLSFYCIKYKLLSQVLHARTLGYNLLQVPVHYCMYIMHYTVCTRTFIVKREYQKYTFFNALFVYFQAKELKMTKGKSIQATNLQELHLPEGTPKQAVVSERNEHGMYPMSKTPIRKVSLWVVSLHI